MSKPSAPRRVAANEARAYVHAIRTSPRKLNLVAQSIRGMNVQVAIEDLKLSRRRIAQAVFKALNAAIANAENNHDLDVDMLYVAEASVGRSFAMRRFRPRARGRVGRITKPFSNLTIVVREREEEK